MDRDDPVLKLHRLHEAAERISTNLVELEIDSGRQLLEATALQGESAARWSAASAALTELWRRHGLLEDLLQKADKVRGPRRADELRSMIEGRSIELSNSEVPLAQRDLLGRSQVAERCSPDELIKGMSSSFDEVKTVVSRIGGAWDTLIPKLDAARAQLQQSARIAEDLGEGTRGDLEAATRTLAALSTSVTTDPLSVRAGEIDDLMRSLQAINDDLEGSATLKRGFEARMLDARELLERLHTAVRDAQDAHDELLVKISVPTAPPVPEAGSELDTGLTEIAALAERGDWRDSRRRLEDWTAQTNALLTAARRALEANRAPIAARNQFRALLDAYQVKAKRLGLVEDPTAADIFAQARATLYTAPTNLALAAQLVRSYQQVVNGNQPTSEAML